MDILSEMYPESTNTTGKQIIKNTAISFRKEVFDMRVRIHRRLLRLIVPVAAIGALSLVFMAGCDGCVEYPNCKDDEHCKEHNEFCVNGLCQQCRDSSNCPEGFQCVNGKCEAIEGYCSENKPCPSPKVCKFNRCAYECERDDQCGPGQMCQNYRCVQKPSICTSDDDCDPNEYCDNGDCLPRRGDERCALENIYFDFDESKLRNDARATLKANYDCLAENNGSRVLIEGHCDERGTDEYNLALGEDRAKASKKFLIKLGTAPAYLDTVTYGEARPDKYCHNESCWKWNRRCVFVWQ